MSEVQEEEIEVLESIYGSDAEFCKVSSTEFRYRFGEENAVKSFIVAVKWSEQYPEECPVISLDIFYNKHLCEDVKQHIKSELNKVAEKEVGSPMTYAIFEHARENFNDLTDYISIENRQKANSAMVNEAKKGKEKKEQLTKSQKRKIISRLDHNGEQPRGYNWVSLSRHLQQSGAQS